MQIKLRGTTLSRYRLVAAGVVIASVVASSTTTTLSASAEPLPTRTAVVSPAPTALSDEDVLALFAGQGRVLREHPELRAYVPDDQGLSSEQVRALTREYIAADPAFHRKVTVPLQSGDPYRTLDALKAFQTMTASISTDSTTSSNDGKCALLVAVAVAAALWLGVFVWIARSGDSGLSDEQFAAAVATSMSRSEG